MLCLKRHLFLITLRQRKYKQKSTKIYFLRNFPMHVNSCLSALFGENAGLVNSYVCCKKEASRNRNRKIKKANGHHHDASERGRPDWLISGEESFGRRGGERVFF